MSNLAPSLLIASPQMRNPFFERTVVLLWHHDEDGAIGVVVNRTLEQRLPDVLDLDEDVDLSVYQDTPVVWGGPVETTMGTVVTTEPSTIGEDGWQLPRGLGVTRSHDGLIQVVRARAPLMLCLGYAGWGAGQLDREIEEGGWLFTDADPFLLFQTPSEERYERALATLGLTPSTVWMQPIDE
ncbi:MAG: YqgE/AlgH family protein [Myxococcota bacterium]